MTHFINNYYFSLVFATMLVVFSIPLTDFYTQNVWLYGIMTFVILHSTVVIEMILNQTHELKAKGKKMLWTIVPIHVIVFSIFILFIF